MLTENKTCHCIYELKVCEKELACISCTVSKKFWKTMRKKSPETINENKPMLTNQ